MKANWQSVQLPCSLLFCFIWIFLMHASYSYVITDKVGHCLSAHYKTDAMGQWLRVDQEWVARVITCFRDGKCYCDWIPGWPPMHMQKIASECGKWHGILWLLTVVEFDTISGDWPCSIRSSKFCVILCWWKWHHALVKIFWRLFRLMLLWFSCSSVAELS